MDMHIPQPTIELQPLSPLRLRVSAGRHLTGISGTTWVTLDGDPRDIILERGQTHTFDHGGNAMVQAMGGDAKLVAEDGVEVLRSLTLASAWDAAMDALRGLARVPGRLA